MTVLHIITDANIGGAGRHILTFLDALNGSDIKIEVALPTGSKLISELQARNVHHIEVTHIDTRSFSLNGVKALHAVIRDRKPDIVHTHASLAGRLAARICGCKIIHTRHSVFPPSTKERAFGFINNRLSDAIIAVSPAAKENLEQIGTDPGRITTIYNGVPPIKKVSSEKKAELRNRYDIPQNAFVVSQIARLVEEKGHDYTLDAAKMLQDITIVIAGDGPLLEHLRGRVHVEKINNVIMLGFVHAVDEIHHISDLQINTSYGTEATSLSLLEGMSLGIPAVVSDFGGNPFVITNRVNGLVVSQKNATELAHAVQEIKNDKDLYQSLSDGAVVEYKARFTASDMARNIENLYKNLLRESV